MYARNKFVISSSSESVDELSRHISRNSYANRWKRWLDCTLILMASPVVLALVSVMAAATMLRDGHNPFFLQRRVGRDGKIFQMVKMRTMVPDAHKQLERHLKACPEARSEWDKKQKLQNDPRITRLGALLRKTSMDELPQLWNVLKGDMSLVGPRPMMPEQKDYYHGSAYFRLRPGISGFWQISDRHQADFVDRVLFDEAYEKTLSFKTDVITLWRTVAVVLRGTGC